jgi:hypothetical protein
MGGNPWVCAQAVSDVRRLSVVRSLPGVRTSGGRRTFDVSSLDRCRRISGSGRSSGRCSVSDVWCHVGHPAAVACIVCGSSGWPVRVRVGRPVDRRTSGGCSFAAAPSSLPRFPRGWCRRSLLLALLLLVREAPAIPMHAHERNAK